MNNSDGRNPAKQLRHISLQSLLHPRWCRISEPSTVGWEYPPKTDSSPLKDDGEKNYCHGPFSGGANLSQMLQPTLGMGLEPSWTNGIGFDSGALKKRIFRCGGELVNERNAQKWSRTGWWFQSISKILVKLDHFSMYYGLPNSPSRGTAGRSCHLPNGAK